MQNYSAKSFSEINVFVPSALTFQVRKTVCSSGSGTKTGARTGTNTGAGTKTGAGT